MYINTFVKSLCFFFILSLFFIACKKEAIIPEEEIPEEVEEEISNAMTAKIDGVAWEASSILVTMKDGVINVTGLSEDKKEITITVESDEEGEYTLSLVSNHVAVYTPEKNSNDIYSSNGDTSAGGEVELKTVDMNGKLLTGTFEFKAVQPGGSDSVKIAEGNFTKVKIQ